MTGEIYVLPASFGQERLWLLHQLDPTSSAYHVAGGVRLRGRLDVDRLSRAMCALVTRHEALRTTFELDGGGQLAQVVHPVMDIEIPVVAAADGTVAMALAADLVRAPFAIAEGPLLRALIIRVAPDDHRLAVVVHHIVCDGWSLGVLLGELGLLYQHHAVTAALPELPVQYADWALWQREQLDGVALADQLAYWRKQLDGAPALDLPADWPRPSVRNFEGTSIPVRIPAGTGRALRRLAEAERVTPFMAVLAAYCAVLSRWAGQDDVVVGVPVAGRALPEVEPLVGFFVNTLPLRVDLSGEPTFRDLLARARETCLAGYAHQDVPFEKLVEAIGVARSAAVSPLVQVMLALRDVPMPDWRHVIGLVVEPFEMPALGAQFDLSLHLHDEPDAGFAGQAVFRTDLFEPATVRRLIDGLTVLLDAATADPDTTVSRLPLQSAADRKALLERFSGTGVALAGIGVLPELFERQVDRAPDAVALEFEGTMVSYRDLDIRANRLAHYLQDAGVGPNSLVGVAIPRSIEMIVALLAVLKSGGAYVPLDPGYPARRLAHMIEDARPHLVLTVAAAAFAVTGPLEGAAVRLVQLDREPAIEACAASRPVTTTTDRDLAYVIYTSGSTGLPKGAMNAHGPVVNRMCWGQRYLGLGPADRFLHKTPLSFDVSGEEIYPPLISGGRLVIARPDGHRDPGYLCDLIRRARISTVHFVPSMLPAFLADPGAPACAEVLTRVVCSGEDLSPGLVASLRTTLPGVEIYNLYGPTETAIEVSAHHHRHGRQRARTPIGTPISGAHLYVLDRHGEPTPLGVAGELHVGGVPVGQGYHRRPGLTAARFLPDPFTPCGRLYRTGDRARLLADGQIEVLGRLDQQTKIRGVRVELGEVQAALSAHPAVAEAVVVVHPDATGAAQLAAYVTTTAGPVPAAKELRAFLRTQLPEAMIPTTFTHLTTLPLAPSGKLDRDRLPAPEPLRQLRVAVPPSAPVEMVLARIWAEVLLTDDIGVEDDFYECGGNSLRAMTVLSRAQQEGLVLPVSALLGNHTIRTLAAVAGSHT